MGARGNGIWWSMSTLALTLAFGACKDESSGLPPESNHPKNEAGSASSASSSGFTSAEIHRDKPVALDTAGLDGAVSQDVVSTAPVESIPPKTVVVKPAPAVSPAPVKPIAAEPAAAAAVSKNVVPTPPTIATGIVGQPGEAGDWVMQVNVHRSEADAKSQIAKLAQQGIPAYAIPVPTGDATLSGNYWRVRVGRFQSRAEAQSYGKAVLEPKGLKFWVDKKSNETKQGT